MTTPRNRYPDELPPGITADGGDAIRTAAGTATAGRAFVTNRSTEARILAVSFLGVDADWLPEPTRSRVLMPGETVPMDFTLHPAVGTLSAKYPFAITVQAIDPASGQAMSSAAIADYALVVDAPGRVEVQVVPNEITRRLRGSVSIKVTNVGNTPENVRIEINAPDNVDFALAHDQIEVQPGASATVPAKIAIEPQVFGRPTRYSYTVTARGRGAARRTDAAITTRAVLGNTGPKFFAIIAIVALWAGLAITLIPTVVQKINQSGNSAQDNVAQAQDKALDKLRKTQTATPSAGASGAGGSNSGGSGSGGSGSGGSGSGGSGSGGSGGSGSGGSAAGASATGAQPVQFSGTMAGDSPAGVTVSMRPTSLVDEEAQGATGVGVNTDSFTELGKIPAEALTAANAAAPTPGATTSSERSTTTKSDGAWGFAKVISPGYYLVTFAKPGFQSQRFVLDAASAASAEPMKVTLVPGKGRLSGRITGPGGAVGGATITLSDGTNTLASSSNSGADKGAWSVDGLSTPGTYLVTASKDGLSTESSIVTLDAGGVQTANLDLKLNSATLTGRVYGPTTQRDSAPLGNVSVTAKSESTERTSTTITTGNLTGTYRLPDLPAGDYVITTQATGYLTQTRAVTIKEGEKTASLRTDLTSATAVVTGVVRGVQFDDQGNPTSVVGPVNGAGITLSDATNKYKVTTAGNGSFRLDGVAPGSYVLSAQFAGLGTAYADVDVKAGVPVRVPIDALQLPAANNKDSSSITGFVSSATNPSGALVCPQGQSTCQISLELFNSKKAQIDISTDDSSDPSAYKPTATVDSVSTGPTPYSIYASGGIPAGIYRLRVSAVGYLPTTVTVRVPANTVANAPTAALFPTNGLVGTVASTGVLAQDGPSDGASPAKPFTTCVWAKPVTTTGGFSPPTGCTDTTGNTGSSSSLCKTTGQAQDAVTQNSNSALPNYFNPATQSYTLDGLCDGQYAIYVFTTNPWYVNNTTPVFQTLFRGQTSTYSPTVTRDGRVQITVKVRKASSTTTSTPDANTVTATCGTGRSQSTQSGDSVTVDGVDAGTNISCTVSAPGYASKTITIGAVINERDSFAPQVVVLTQPVGDLTGRLVSTYKGNTDMPLANAVVTLTGTVDDGADTKTSDSFTVTTDADGCFAITGRATGDVTASNCSGNTVTSTSVAHGQLLVSSVVTIVNVDKTGFDQTAGNYTLTAAGTKISVRATPVSTTNLRVSVDPTFSDPSGASIVVTKKVAKGAGSVTISSVQADGSFTWQDSGIYLSDDSTTQNKAAPGTYDITASKPGFASASTTITCDLAPSSCALDGSLTLVALGNISGTVTGVLGPNDGQTYPQEPTPKGLAVTATACKADDTYPTCTGATVSATINGADYTFASGGVAALPAGDYKITYNGNGYSTAISPKLTLAKGGARGYNQTIYLHGVDFTVQLQRGTTDYTCAKKTCTVKLKRLDTNAEITKTLPVPGQANPPANRGTFLFADLTPAHYRIEAIGDNFTRTAAADDLEVLRNTNPASTDSTTYDMSVSINETTVTGSVNGLQGAATSPAGLNGVPVQLGHLDGNGNFVVDTDDTNNALIVKTAAKAGVNGQFTFTGVPADSYVLQYNVDNGADFPRLNGYRALPADGTSAVITVTNGAEKNLPTPTTLTRVARNVVVGITTTDGSSDLNSSTLTLNSAVYGARSNPARQADQANAKRLTWTFGDVPFGSDWKLKVVLPAGHLGRLSVGGTEVDQTCDYSPVNNNNPRPAQTCVVNTPIPVSGADTTTAATSDYTLDEYPVSFTLKTKKLDADTAPTDAPATASVTLTESGSAAPVAYRNTALSTANSSGSFFGRAGYTYKSTVTENAARWAAEDKTFSSGAATQDIVIAELGSTVTVTVTGVPADATSPMVTLVTPAGVTPPDAIAPNSDGKAVFDLIPYGSGYKARLTYTKADGTSSGNKDGSAFNVNDPAESTSVTG